MSNIFIIHGTYGDPKENWFPWLKKELEKLGHQVFVPKFPTPKGQNIENWDEVFKRYNEFINEDTIMIGHSLGPSFILSILERRNSPIKASFFVSGFIGSLENKEIDELNKTFTERVFNWDKIKSNCNKFYMFHSDNDPYVPLIKAEELAKKLETNVNIIPGAGHFNEKAGYTKFDQLLEELKKIIF